MGKLGGGQFTVYGGCRWGGGCARAVNNTGVAAAVVEHEARIASTTTCLCFAPLGGGRSNGDDR
jgi:hypothetical protein